MRHRVVARLREQLAVELRPGEAKARHAALARAEHVAFAAQPQVLLGDAEAVSVSRMMSSRAFGVSPSGAL